MTPKQMKKKPIKQIIKIEHEKLNTKEGESTKDEKESTTSTEISEIKKQLKYLKVIMY